MYDFSILIITNNNNYVDFVKKSLPDSFVSGIRSTSSLAEADTILKSTSYKILILDEEIDYTSDFIILLKEHSACSFIIGIAASRYSNIFSQIKEISIYDYLDTPLKKESLRNLIIAISEAERKREELRQTGLYDYLTKPVDKENVDSVISIFYDFMTKPITKDGIEKATSNIYQYITTPITKTDIEGMLKKVARSLSDFRQNSDIENELFCREDELIGKSKCISDIKELLRKVAPTDATVLILGESGSGKELIAKSVFKNSNRKDKNYLTVNCAAISPSLIESELFGYEKGAFTGAAYSKKGIIEEADNGTLFLDEIGDMDINSQAKLLRVIENGELRRVGGTKPIYVNVRFIAATNQNLEEYVEAGRFRRDLYYRLMNFPVYIKPLRERKEDIEILTRFFLFKISARLKRKKQEISKDALDTLIKYDFPGNVRELKNVIERASILGSDFIKIEDLPEDMRQRKIVSLSDKPFYSLHELVKSGVLSIEEYEKALIISALDKTGWNRNEAIKLLGIGRTTLYEKMKKYNFEEPKAEKKY